MDEPRHDDATHHVKWVADLLQFNSNNFLPKHKTLFSGRPRACHFVNSRFLNKAETKTIEVCGLNKENISLYIDQFFGDIVEKAVLVKDIINQSRNFSAMASVPVFLWIICSVYKEEVILSHRSTTTELYFYTCLVFLRNHFQGESLETKRFINLVEEDNIIDFIYCPIKHQNHTSKTKV